MGPLLAPIPCILRAALAAALCLAASGCVLFARDGFRFPAEDFPVQTHVLDNGLTVHLLPNDASPMATLNVWVRVGARDEPAELAGISHFLEHMLFKGTERLAVGEYDRRIEALGGYLNAATSLDYTQYYVMVPSAHVDAALVDLADVVRNSRIDPGEVERERHVILEEIRMKDDNPHGFLYDRVTRSKLEAGPYANTVIGSAETVSAMTAEQLREHFHRFYAPENMAVVVVGDIHPERVLIRIQEVFGDMDRPVRPWRDGVPATRVAPATEQRWARDWQQTYFHIAFPGPAVGSLEEAAVRSVAEAVLSGGRSSRLVNALVEKQRLVISIGASMPGAREPHLASIHGACDAAALDAVRRAVEAEVHRLRAEGLRRGELARAKRQVTTSHLYSSETNSNQAWMLGYGFVVFGRPDLLAEFPAAVERVTERQVLDALAVFDFEQASLFAAGPFGAAAETAIP